MHLINKFLRQDGGQFTLIMSLGFFFLVMIAGGAIDFNHAQSQKQKLQSAADISALAAASYAISEPNVPTGKIRKKAKDAFFENCRAKGCESITSPVVKIDTETITVEANLKSQTMLLGLIGMDKFDLHVRAKSLYAPENLNTHIHAYFIVDVSSSMSIADGLNEMNDLMANYKPASNPVNGCAFACHEIYPGDVLTGAQIAQNLGIMTRNERVALEVRRISQEILHKANGRATISLIIYGEGYKDKPLYRETLMSVVDTGLNGIVYGVDGTNHDFAMPVIQQHLPKSGGDGSAASPNVIAVLVTDGVDNYKDAAGVDFTKSMDPAVCQPIKDRGIELFVLNVNYPDPTLFKYNGPTVARVSAIYDQLVPSLRACSSPDRYYEGRFNTDVTDAFNDILEGVTEVYDDSEARLTR